MIRGILKLKFMIINVLTQLQLNISVGNTDEQTLNSMQVKLERFTNLSRSNVDNLIA